MLIPSTLFLHGGPGLNAGVERAWFGDSLPVLWWDQPPIGSASAPFEALVTACLEQLRKMAGTGEMPIKLLASSFGGKLAAALANRAPQLIQSITLLGCAPDLISAIRRLGTSLHAGYPDDHQLRNALESTDQFVPAVNELMSLFGACGVYHPTAYFAPRSKQALDRYISLSDAMRFDMATFEAILRESLAQQTAGHPSPFCGPVKLILGTHDRLINPAEDEAAWRRIFPHLQCEMHDCGHMVHFEVTPNIWL